ncbi:hypothetical protein SAMN04488134_10238 [Amphibacillus marinus]|uniref:Uncharacterized protein n=1 Tax=Amphibacillus marinus TaxID=872970 RepID=A0A1H8JPW5_9BACI|nr:hypothetical protein [Amphibacillus marinus]SEN82803.1 hypothetical protein SAMN04488134_10238 [Amphibacillus marinus]
MKYQSVYLTLRWLSKNRRRKKKELNKLAWNLILSWVEVIYLIPFGFITLLLIRDYLFNYMDLLLRVTGLGEDHFLITIIVIGVFRPLSLSYARPGLLFSDADLLLDVLPYQRKRMYQYHFLERMKTILTMYVLVGLVIAIVTPLTNLFVIRLVVSLVGIECLMIMPQWYLFHGRWYMKWIVIQFISIVIGVVIIIAILYSLQYLFAIVVSIFLICLNGFYMIKGQQVHDLAKAVDVNNRLIWQSGIVGIASGIKSTPMKRLGFYHHFIRNKMMQLPFKSDKGSYHRLILLMFAREKEQLIKAVASLIVITLALSVNSLYIFAIGITISIFLFVKMAVSFFNLLFEERLLLVLPWQMEKWKQVYTQWLLLGTLVWVALLWLASWFWVASRIHLFILLPVYVIATYLLCQAGLSYRAKKVASKLYQQPSLLFLEQILLYINVGNAVINPISCIFIIIYGLMRYTYVNHIVK